MKKYIISTALVGTLALTGCNNLTPGAEVALATSFGGRAPTNEVQQIYYLGVFDPREQVPPTIYRVRVLGQAAAISRTRFASGWVPASIADSLGSKIEFDEQGNISIENGDGDSSSILEGRGLVAFGPEGFREAPRDHRLVIVMGSNPQGYFSAVDRTLGTIAQVRDAQENQRLTRLLLSTLADLRQAEGRLAEIRAQIPGGS